MNPRNLRETQDLENVKQRSPVKKGNLFDVSNDNNEVDEKDKNIYGGVLGGEFPVK